MDSVVGTDKTRLKINIPVGGRKKTIKKFKNGIDSKSTLWYTNQAVI